MKYFKVKASRMADKYEVNKNNFESYTENKPPFEQVGNDGEARQYGICPSCLNPVRLIGIYKDIKRNPYAKHTGEDVNNLPKWNLYKYQHCPFAKTNDKRPINIDERGAITDDTVELYNILRMQFDRVVYIITKSFGVKGSLSFWENALKKFRESEGYCYPWLTESNLPYIFAFFGLQQQKLYNQEIAVDSDIYNTLRIYPPVLFEGSGKFHKLVNKEKQYVDLRFRFTEHKQCAKDGEELKESIKFCIDDWNNNNKTIFEKTIDFDETYFSNLIRKVGNEDKRNRRLIDLANEHLPPITAN